MKNAHLILWLSGFLGTVSPAQQPPRPVEPDAPAAPAIRELAPGIYQVGEVKLEKAARRVSFPARINMAEGPVEYLLVTAMGKTHESVLVTDIAPHHLQVAMLLLGARGTPAAALTNAPAGGPITQGGAGRNPPLPGDPVLLEVAWTQAGQPQRKRLEEWVFNRRTRAPMTKGPFTFTGSRVWQGKFIAQTEGSIIALITDPDAVFNNPRPSRDADDTWLVRKQDVPPLNSLVEVSITLPPPPKPPAGPGK